MGEALTPEDIFFLTIATLSILFVLWVVAVAAGIDPRGDK
jgi:hypothetical protein